MPRARIPTPHGIAWVDDDRRLPYGVPIPAHVNPDAPRVKVPEHQSDADRPLIREADPTLETSYTFKTYKTLQELVSQMLIRKETVHEEIKRKQERARGEITVGTWGETSRMVVATFDGMRDQNGWHPLHQGFSDSMLDANGSPRIHLSVKPWNERYELCSEQELWVSTAEGDHVFMPWACVGDFGRVEFKRWWPQPHGFPEQLRVSKNEWRGIYNALCWLWGIPIHQDDFCGLPWLDASFREQINLIDEPQH